MLQHVDDKLQSMTAGLLTFGSVALFLGVLSLFSIVSIQIFAAVLFFMISYLAFYMGYKLHVMQCAIHDNMPFGMGGSSSSASKSRGRRK